MPRPPPVTRATFSSSLPISAHLGGRPARAPPSGTVSHRAVGSSPATRGATSAPETGRTSGISGVDIPVVSGYRWYPNGTTSSHATAEPRGVEGPHAPAPARRGARRLPAPRLPRRDGRHGG